MRIGIRRGQSQSVLHDDAHEVPEEASIITPPYASPHTVFSSANERRFPPLAPGGAKCLAYPRVPHPEAPPIRPERHTENDRDDPKTTHGRAGPNPHALPVLSSLAATTALSGIVVKPTGYSLPVLRLMQKAVSRFALLTASGPSIA
jgi:hypothetical protein